jgi:hypothetical protein
MYIQLLTVKSNRHMLKLDLHYKYHVDQLVVDLLEL